MIDTVRADRLELGAMDRGKATGRPVWETIDFSQDLPVSALHRYELDVARARLVSARPLAARPLDFPVVNPRCSARKHTFVWASCGALVKGADGKPLAAPPQVRGSKASENTGHSNSCHAACLRLSHRDSLLLTAPVKPLSPFFLPHKNLI